ncbi:CLUMA_CG020656, isoform C [Clunio marinus]|uniref:CLUMA_CG020656, isoform C n=1 Tax=Clunio marinus TaxID=568069 RepID=A0A1J1J5M2_9DIPT|nr:CLUMA_CG020656, isoform C [Clunio marinus]
MVPRINTSLVNFTSINGRDKNDQNRLVGPPFLNGSARSSFHSTHSIKSGTPPPNNSTRNDALIINTLSRSPKATKLKKFESTNNSKRIVNKNSKMQQQTLQQLIDQQSLEKQKQTFNVLHTNKGVEALGVLVQYLVFNLDAFSSPSLKKSLQKTTRELIETKINFDEIKTSHQNLEDKLNDREDYFNKRECEMQELHRCEINKVKKLLEDLENEKKDEIQSLEAKLNRNEEEAEEKLRIFIRNSDEKLSLRDVELQAVIGRETSLLERLQSMTVTENELREKVHKSEIEFSEKLHNSNIRECELTETINMLTKQLDEVKLKAENEKRELEEKLNLLQDELLITRQPRSSPNESFLNKSMNLNHSQLLQDEVESLRCVLELKQSEISDLRKQNGELQRAADDSIAAQAKCSALESRVEDLQVQLDAKHDDEKELLKKLKQLQDAHDNVHQKSARLALHNEELQWRLKQNAERYSHTINELSKSYHDSSMQFNRSNSTFNEFEASGKPNGSILDCSFANEGSSPPTSPIIKGVVEKNDSVSWVLEIDDETKEASANRMVQRAGSFRTYKCPPSPIAKRQKCQNNSSIQQSASAASILRQHSEPSTKTPTNTRIRSKSVSTNKPEDSKKIVKKFSKNSQEIQESSWANLKASSPIEKKEEKEIKSIDKYRETRKLVTRDVPSLSTGELKKQRPKMISGKVIVRGSNSEDDEEASASTSSTPSIEDEMYPWKADGAMELSWCNDGEPSESNV